MRFMQGEEFLVSVRTLYQKGGRYQKAAETVHAVWGRAKLGNPSLEDVFIGVAVTNNGERRLPHAVKYDLTGFSRLVTVVSNGLCILLYAGDHDTVDRWLDRNAGHDFVARETDGGVVLEKVRLSESVGETLRPIHSQSDLSSGSLMDLLPKRYQDRILQGLEDDSRADVAKIESISDDDSIFAVSSQCPVEGQQMALIDVLLSLRAGDVTNAKSRIDLYCNAVTPIEQLPQEEVLQIQSSEAAVLLSDVDPQLFQHFVETATFDKWMLYLHPAQRTYVDRDYDGPSRMAGVSGSGKTCVVVHRALRLADLYSSERVAVVTLSGALATLIDRLIDAQRGSARPKNLEVLSIFDLCFNKLMELEPNRRDYYTKRSIARNPHATSEHVDEVWDEYFKCENNNRDSDVMFDVIKSLNARGIYASDYLRQEFDYIRSTFAPGERDGYLSMERSGRIVPFDERFRRMVLDGLQGWEKKMDAVGVIDDMGIVSSLYRHLGGLSADYRAALVDEVQDLGTLELAIVRKLVASGENDLFLCGDAAQSIYTKSADLRLAGITLAGRTAKLNKNYRNSRQILTAAHNVLTRALAEMPKGAADIEVLEPEFASFSSPKPLLLEAASLRDEVERALSFFDEYMASNSSQRGCLAISGYGQAAVERLGEQLQLPVLAPDTDLGSARLYLSDLEQTKGFEFDVVVVVNVSSGVMPHPDLPPEESFRDLCRLYVAMTRAKTQLAISYSGNPSQFLTGCLESFTVGKFADYAEQKAMPDVELPKMSIPSLGNPEAWGLSGSVFLRSRDAVGLDRTIQDEILEHVTGRERVVGRTKKQMEWKTFGAFAKGMEQPRVRHQVISEEAWGGLSSRLTVLRQSASTIPVVQK